MSVLRPLAGLVLAAGLAASARAGMDAALAMPENARYVGECGACHAAYAPAFLPRHAWRVLMAGLGDHFGTDAGLDPAVGERLLAELLVLAADTPAADPFIARHPASDSLRISTSAFFRYMHDEVPAAVWRRPKIASNANCGACHPRADEGRYFEREIRIPK